MRGWGTHGPAKNRFGPRKFKRYVDISGNGHPENTPNPYDTTVAALGSP
jgi:hypothetical protein